MAPAAPKAVGRAKTAGGRARPGAVALVGGGLLVLVAVVSLMVGSDRIDGPATVLRALSGQADQLLVAAVRDVRLPRTLVAALIGAGLAVAGALIQAITRNPIVEPSTIGVNAGAALGVCLVSFFGGVTAIEVAGVDLMPFVAFAGAAVAVVLVFAFVGTGRATPGRIALAGVTVALLANALVMSTIILNDAATRYLIRFLVGGVDGVTWGGFTTLTPYVAIGLVGSFLMARAVTVLSLGDDVAHGLGLPVRRTRLLGVGIVVVLAGAAVAVAGPISMVGLMVPHAARFLVGTDYRRILPVSALLGALLLVAADVVSRLLVRGTEIPVGVLTAVLGTPYFIYLARQGRSAV